MRKSGSFNIHALILGLAAVVFGSGLARLILTGGINVSHKVEITFWNGFTGPDGIVMLGIIDRFNEANPDVHVTMQRIPWGTYYNKLTVAGSDGRGPAAFVIHADGLLRYYRAGFIDDANPIFEGPNAVPRDDYDPYVLKQVMRKGQMIGCPLDIHPNGMFLDADMLKAAGLVDSDGNARPPKNRTEFESAMKKLMKDVAPDKIWGYAFTDPGANFRTLMAQFDGQFLDEKGNAAINSPQNLTALTVMDDWSKQKIVPPPTNGLGWLGYRQQKVGMVWDGVFMLGDLKRVNTFKYMGAMIPTIGNHPGATANSHVLCLRKGLSAKEKDAATRFIKYVSAHSIEWADAGQIPARLSIRKDPKFADMQVQHAFAEEIPYLQYPPHSPVNVEIVTAVGLAVDQVVRQIKTPKEALDIAQKTAQEAIDRDRQDHPEDQP